MNDVLIGKKATALRGEFLEPNREVFFYFGGDENPMFGAGLCRIPPLSSNEEHAHPDADEIIYMISGEMKMIEKSTSLEKKANYMSGGHRSPWGIMKTRIL